KKKISGLEDAFLLASPDDGAPEVQHWLGHRFIENRGRQVREPILQYLLRHTRLLPRDIVILGNKLSELVSQARHNGETEVPQEAIRQCVREVARSFGNEQLAICANHIASSGMPADAARRDYVEVYTGDTEFSRGLVDDLRALIQAIGKDRFDRQDLEVAMQLARERFGDSSDALSVLWQNRLLGYLEPSPDGPREVFFSEVSCDHFNLPLNQTDYILHSCMIDSVGVRAVGAPVGQGAMQAKGMTAPDANGPVRVGGYPILGVIGKGGMGTVYLAEDPRLKRRIAIKMLPDSQPLGAAALVRFQREAQILARLSHPNIAMVYSLEDDGGVHFITMEFVTGINLSQHIVREAIDPERSYRICRQIAVAVDAAHRQGIVHRDLKPSNVMVTPHEQVKVLDFGLAKVVSHPEGHSDSSWMVSRVTQPDHVVGTLGYMSPEQLRGREVDSRCDVWGFGCCFYECLTGRMAFPGQTLAERAAATLERDPDLAALGALPDPISDLIRRSLEKDPSRRLSSLSDAIELIDRVCAYR